MVKIVTVLFLVSLAASSGYAEDYTIEDSFVISLPESSTVRERTPRVPSDIGYPKVWGRSFSFQTYWWTWVKPEEDLMTVPAHWDEQRGDFNRVTKVAPFAALSGLEGVLFHTVITNNDRPDFHSEMLLLRDQKNHAMMFQMTGAPDLVEDAFKSIRYK
jgi:hypothetical protein